MQHRQLEAFIATMQTGSTTAAATSLFISQPSVSRLIADLEAEIGFALFVRGKGRLQPTPEAIEFFQHVLQSFRGLEMLKHTAISIRANSAGRLRVAAVPALSLGLLPRICQVFHSRHPDVALSVYSLESARLLLELQEGSTDIGLMPSQAELPSIVQNHLADVEFACAIPPGDPLAEKELIEPADLRGKKVIMFDPIGDFVWRRHAKALEQIENAAGGRISTTASHVAYGLVAEGLGIAIVDAISAQHWGRQGVQVRRFRPLIEYQFVAAFPAGRARPKLVQEFFLIGRQLAKTLLKSAFKTPMG